MKQKLKCYVATAYKTRFHFQFPRAPDAAFGGLSGWLFNWKCKFSCRIISEISNYLKYNYFWDGDGIDNATLRLRKFSDFCSRHTVGVAGEDIMFHILVNFVIVCVARLPSFIQRFEIGLNSVACHAYFELEHSMFLSDSKQMRYVTITYQPLLGQFSW